MAHCAGSLKKVYQRMSVKRVLTCLTIHGPCLWPYTRRAVLMVARKLACHDGAQPLLTTHALHAQAC